MYVVSTKHYKVHSNISKQYTEEAAKIAEAAFADSYKRLYISERNPSYLKTITYNFAKKGKVIKNEPDLLTYYSMPGDIIIKDYLFNGTCDLELPDGRKFIFFKNSMEGHKIKIYIYASEAEAKKNVPKTSGLSPDRSYFNELDGTIILVLTKNPGYRNLNSLIHEISHQIVRYAVFNLPVWFDEGLAEYAGVTDIGNYKVGVMRLDYLNMCIQSMRNGTFTPLKKLVGMKYEEFHCKDINQEGLHYAEAWSLVNFLASSEHPKLKGKLPKYYAELRKGKGNIEAFKKIYDVKLVEAEWKRIMLVSSGLAPM